MAHLWRRSLAATRRRYWRRVRLYPYELCDDCGRRVDRCTGTWWRAASGLWPQLVGDATTILCPRCFTARADTADLALHYEAMLDVDVVHLTSRPFSARPPFLTVGLPSSLGTSATRVWIDEDLAALWVDADGYVHAQKADG